MNDDQLDDLKQFISATVSQTEARLTERIDGVEQKVDTLEQKVDTLEQKVDTLEQKVDTLEQKVDDGFAGIGEAIEEIHDQIDARGKVIESK